MGLIKLHLKYTMPFVVDVPRPAYKANYIGGVGFLRFLEKIMIDIKNVV